MHHDYVDRSTGPILAEASPMPDEVAARCTPNLAKILWRGLLEGSLVILRAETHETHTSLTFGARCSSLAITSDRRIRMAILEAALCGAPQYVIALDYHLAASTVAFHLRSALKGFGLDLPFRRAPLGLGLLVHASRRPASLSVTIHGDARLQALECCVVDIQRTEARLASVLAPAELTVAGLLLEGKSYADIAAYRRTSLRTVANQLSAVGRKLRTRGRFDLLRVTVER